MKNSKIEDETSKVQRLYSRHKLIGKIRDYAESLKGNSEEEKQNSFTIGVVNECISALNKLNKLTPEEKNCSSIKDLALKSKKKEKEFVARNSILTDLFEINHFVTIRNIFTAVLLLFFMSNILEEYYMKSSTKLQAMIWSFKKLDKTLYIWIVMLFSTLIPVYKVFQVWVAGVDKCGKIWNKLWLTIYILYQCAFLYFPTKYILHFNLPPVCSIIILIEQVRMMMKIHSFVRSNAANVLEKPKSKKCPEMSKYIYYIFAPTLIYKDEYPRTSHIRFKFVFTNICQVIACIYYMTIVIFDHVSVFNTYGLSTHNSSQVIQSVMSLMVPGAFLLICVNFLLLHSWLNALAELLRFADRQFYTDWWNSRNFAMYYRTWNVVVHDWLHAYVFRDITRFFPSSKYIPITCVFFISSVIHDYIMSFAFRFFLPMYLIMFGCIGEFLYFVPKKENRRNFSVLFWTGLICGNSIMISLYSMEWHARKHCPPYSDTYIDLFIPRMWVYYRNISRPIATYKV